MRLWAVASCVLSVACTPPGPADRADGSRSPLSAPCDARDETRCLLPWPSNTYTVADSTSATGLRVSIQRRSLPQLDNPAPLNQLDGFSVATALAVGFDQAPAPELSGQKNSGAVLLFSMQGERVPLRLLVVSDAPSSAASLLLAYPMHPLTYDTDYVAVVLDDVQPATGGTFTAPPSVQVALKLVPAQTDEERALAAYHAPIRTLLQRQGVDVRHVLRVWDFTTRSAASVAAPLAARRAASLGAVEAQATQVLVTSAEPRLGGGLEVLGHVDGLPSFITDAGVLTTETTGTHPVPFRAVLPPGSGPLPVVVFGHGTGNDVGDQALDDVLLGTGAAKLNLEFAGWTRTSVAATFLGFESVLSGTERSTAKLAQSLLDATALEALLEGQLGQVLTAASIVGKDNPAAGRTIDAKRLGYFGSSLGGTLGFTHTLTEPRIGAAVLNVPGAGCTQFFQQAEQWQQLDAVFSAKTPSAIDRALALVLSQTSWDPVDGAAWVTQPGTVLKPVLIQESIGDVVMPNLASELVAASMHAAQVGHVIEPVLDVEAQPSADGRAALTQFRLPSTMSDSGAIHAFVTKGTPAGIAAREQLSAFFTSVWAGAPRVVEPPTCSQNVVGCDFFAVP